MLGPSLSGASSGDELLALLSACGIYRAEILSSAVRVLPVTDGGYRDNLFGSIDIGYDAVVADPEFVIAPAGEFDEVSHGVLASLAEFREDPFGEFGRELFERAACIRIEAEFEHALRARDARPSASR